MTSFADELALDRLEAELAAELPSHVRAFAIAAAAGTTTPRAPEVLRRRTSLELALRALSDVALRPRACRLLRELSPIAIEEDPAVIAARDGERSWAGFEVLAAARNAAALQRFNRGDHIAWMHWLHGIGEHVPETVDWPADLEGWHDPAPAIPHAFVERGWRDLADRHGARGICRIVQSDARPRAFIVEPGREVIVLIGALTTPALRFAALHELGHALAALLSPVMLPRVLDEAAASYVARLLEREGDLDLPWFTPLAIHARDRRLTISKALDARERGRSLDLPRPPWSLWHDPGAQAAYVVAEQFADRWWAELGAAPDPGAFARRLAEDTAQLDP